MSTAEPIILVTLILNLDIWRAKDGRLLARFWSRNDEVDCCSYEIVGLFQSAGQQTIADAGAKGRRRWVPKRLRDEYENWVLSEMPFVFPFYQVTERT